MSQALRDYSILLLSRHRISSLFFSPNLFAVYLICLLPLSYYLLSSVTPHAGTSPNKTADAGKTALGLLTFLLFLLCLFLTRSIGGVATLLTGCALIFAITYKTLRKRMKVLSLLAIGALFVFGTLIVWSRVDYFLNLRHPDNSITQRLFYWQTALRIIRDHWCKGIGPGNFRFFYTRYMNPLATETRFAHNVFLQTFAETGLIGFIGFLVFIGALSSFSIKVFSRGKDGGITALQKSCALGVCFFLIHNMVSFSFYQPESAFLFWIYLGVIASRSAPAPLPHSSRKKTALYWSVALLTSVFLCDLFMYTTADYCFWTSARGTPASLQKKKCALALNPLELSYYLELATLSKESDPIRAIDLYQQAIGIAPAYYYPYLEASKVLYALNRDNEALPYLLRARLLYPSHPEIKMLLSKKRLL
ncbi:MAG: O-antigen ligase family protein [Candidatus Omnitrophica bacterium]|nr:O-antigen ligase family protein [Candidatus Omnitrophota bacterium]